MIAESYGNVEYGLVNEEVVLSRVRKQAMDNARQRGAELADLAGKSLESIVSLSSTSPCQSMFEVPFRSGMEQARSKNIRGADPERLEIRESIQVTFSWHDKP